MDHARNIYSFITDTRHHKLKRCDKTLHEKDGIIYDQYGNKYEVPKNDAAITTSKDKNNSPNLAECTK